MSKQAINIGTVPDDGTGDTLYAGGAKINNNFNEVYGVTGLLKSDGVGNLAAAAPGTDFEPAKGGDDNYVTNAEKIVIGNTSGANTGDQVIDFTDGGEAEGAARTLGNTDNYAMGFLVNNFEALKINPAASAVNYLNITPSATTDPVIVGGAGTDTDIDLLLSPKGAGKVGVGVASPDTILDINGALTIRELSADPGDPDEGAYVMWMSDGTGSGDDGDIMVKITAGAATKTTTLLDFSVL